MNFEKTITVPTAIDEAWELLMDMSAVGDCVPGLKSIEEIGEDRYHALMQVKVGAMKVNFDGEIRVVERDREALRARMEAKGSDKRVGGAVNAVVDMSLREVSANEVEVTVVTEAAILGKLGQLGQAVMIRKADQVMSQFARNLAARLEGPAEEAPPVAVNRTLGTAGPAPVTAGPGPETETETPAPAVKQTLWERLRAWLRARRGSK